MVAPSPRLSNCERRLFQGCRSKRKGSGGFTIIEVALAIGVVAFAMVPMIGLLPVGVDATKKALDATVTSQIAQQLTTQAEQTNFSEIQTLTTGTTSCFDDQGNQTSAANAVYQAGFLVASSTALPSGVTTQRLATITICVLDTKANRTDTLSNPTLSHDSQKFTVLIPDNGL